MAYIVDRRPNSKNKSAVNRQRFLRRYKEHIKRAVADAISKRSITDVTNGEHISIPTKDISEPVFHHGSGGIRNIIHPGNKNFIAGDRIARPNSGGGGQGAGRASNTGEGMDEFVFQISQEEFLEFLFEDLALPNLIRKRLGRTDSYKYVHAGIATVGNPSKINIVRSMRSAITRRRALRGSIKDKIALLEAELAQLMSQDQALRDQELVKKISAEIEHFKRRAGKIPFIDTLDLRYNITAKQHQPTTQAVMFCLMDVSGSMNQATKDMAKRFFLLLYLFLKRNYDKIDVVFIRHHTSAKEVDEEEFFYSRETGGTIVSSALKLMKQIIDERYPTADWNIYAAQASDGDNWNDDSPVCRDLLINSIMPKVQYFAYVEITPREHQALWHEYEGVQQAYDDSFALQQIVEAGDIYPVFRELFQRKVH